MTIHLKKTMVSGCTVLTLAQNLNKTISKLTIEYSFNLVTNIVELSVIPIDGYESEYPLIFNPMLKEVQINLGMASFDDIILYLYEDFAVDILDVILPIYQCIKGDSLLTPDPNGYKISVQN